MYIKNDVVHSMLLSGYIGYAGSGRHTDSFTFHSHAFLIFYTFVV